MSFHELDLVKFMYIAHERQCQDHVRYQEHQDKPDNQFAVSPGPVHILLTDFSNRSTVPLESLLVCRVESPVSRISKR
jgi:hypothetical protein